MKLTTKLIGVVIFCICVLQIINGVVLVKGESDILDTDLRGDVERLGRVIKRQTEDVWNRQGVEHALRLIEDANSKDNLIRIRLVSLDNHDRFVKHPHVEPERLQPLKNGHEVSFDRIVKNDRSYYLYYVPLSLRNFPGGALELAEDLGPKDNHIRSIIYRTGIITILMVLAGGLTAVFLGITMVGRPLHLLADKARRVGIGDLSAPLQLKGRDELSELSAAMNVMCDDLAKSRDKIRMESAAKITALEQLRHADRLKTVGTLSSGVAHEIGTPLNVISGRAGMIASGNFDNEEIRECAVIIKNQTQRITNIIQQLLKFTRKTSFTKKNTNIPDLVNDTLALLHSSIKKRNICVDVKNFQVDDPAPSVNVDPNQIQQVLTNLIVNAIHSVGEKGKIVIGFHHEKCISPEIPQDPLKMYLRIDIADNGRGIPETDLHHIFDPFFTTKDVGEGTGLGLSIAYGIAKEHGGWIDVHSELDVGSRFDLYLPMEDE